jgi:hypothetical protein
MILFSAVKKYLFACWIILKLWPPIVLSLACQTNREQQRAIEYPAHPFSLHRAPFGSTSGTETSRIAEPRVPRRMQDDRIHMVEHDRTSP